jgi:hypothetical protein
MPVETVAPLIGAFFTGVLGPLSVAWYRSYQAKKRLSKRDTVADELRFSKEVTNKLDYIKEKFRANRVWIAQFHNGGNYLPVGRSIQKFSIFHEVLSPDVQPIKLLFQNIPVTLFSRAINKIYEDGVLGIQCMKSPESDQYGLKNVMIETGCRSYYCFGIFSYDHKFLGMLGVEYLEEETVLSSDESSDLEIEATMVGGLLNSYFEKNHK